MVKKEYETTKIRELKQKIDQIENEKNELEKSMKKKSSECQQLAKEKEQVVMTLGSIKESREQEKKESSLLQRKVYQLIEELKKQAIKLEEKNSMTHQTLINVQLMNKQLEKKLEVTEGERQSIQASYDQLNNTKMMKWTRKYWQLKNRYRKGN